MDSLFKGKVGIVTGSSYGIGKSTAISFANKGASVVLSDRADDIDTLDAITALGGKAIFVKADVSNEEDVKRIVSETIKHFGRLDFAFNNAGIEGSPAPAADCTNDNWNNTININLTGVWYSISVS